MTILKVEDFTVEITYKKIKNIHLRISSYHGVLRVSAPRHTPDFIIREFVLSKRSWIGKQQTLFLSKSQSKPLEYLQGEIHKYQGQSYKLVIVEVKAKPRVEIKGDSLILSLRPQESKEKREEILNQWYREQLKQSIPPLILKYESLMGVRVKEFGIKRMKTRWGTCHIRDHRIWLNLELAKKPLACLEYIVVHEMVHLLEGSHNKRFYNLMEQFFPDEKSCSLELDPI